MASYDLTRAEKLPFGRFGVISGFKFCRSEKPFSGPLFRPHCGQWQRCIAQNSFADPIQPRWLWQARSGRAERGIFQAVAQQGIGLYLQRYLIGQSNTRRSAS